MLLSCLITYMILVETPYAKPLWERPEPDHRRIDLKPATQYIHQIMGRNRILIMLPQPIRIGMRDQIMRYLLTPTPTKFSFGDELLTLTEENLANELSRTDYIWLPEVDARFDEKISSRFSRIGYLRIIRVNQGMPLTFEPVDQPHQIKPRHP